MHYFISDTHFTHTGAALRHSRRPFESIEDHDRALVEAWNSVVQPSDTVWHLGDFASDKPDPKAMRRIFGQLRGSKHLIAGNHDGNTVKDLGWSSVRDYAEIAVDRQRLILSHYPMRVWNAMRHGSIQLYGHCHGKLPPTAQSIDIGIDVFGIAPVTWPQIRARLATLPPLEFQEDTDAVAGLDVEPEAAVEDGWVL